MKQIIGGIVSGSSVAIGLLFVTPTDQLWSWPWFAAIVLICVGTGVGEAIRNFKSSETAQ